MVSESALRRRSGRPGAEGAPLLVVDDGVNFEVEVLVVVDGWVEDGAMRRDLVRRKGELV